VLGALRKPVSVRLKVPVKFVVERLVVERDWAFVQAEPQHVGGRQIDGARLFGDTWSNMDGLTTTAILRRQNGVWAVVELRIGALDAWYCGFVPSRQFEPCA
jgi:hypothetical protein